MDTKNFNAKARYICPAGKIFRSEATVDECLHQYKLEDVVDAVKHENNIYYEKDKYFKKWAKRCIPFKKRELPEVFQAFPKTRFQTAIDDLKNTCYASYWNKQLGTRKNILLPFPVDVPVHTITFGIPTPSSVTVKEVLNHYWRLEEPSPRDKIFNKRKGLIRPLFKNECKRFAYDPRGIWMKCCLNWVSEDLTVGDSILADFQEEYGAKLGERYLIPKPM